jgi:catechol 2,3-dioxygenase-like lactoylglutathione lyase family enzyme
MSAIHVAGLDHFVLRVRDLDAALVFYRDLLGLHIQFLDAYRAGTRPFVSVCIGEQLLDLVPDPTYDPTAGMNAGGFLHLCVRVSRPPMAELITLLKARGIQLIDDQPVPRMGATGVGLSIYVRDPNGYIVEIKEQNVGKID